MIIVLNGPSSSGKTTLSRNLQKIWPKPLYYLSYDLVDHRIAPFGHAERSFSDPESGEALDPVRDFLSVMYLCAAAIDRSDRDVVIDNCLFDTEDIRARSEEIMAGCDILFVRIRIDPVTLNEREKARGDRTIGKAAWQLEHITPKEDGAYDLVVSTDRPSVECARQILQKAYPEL